MKHKVRRVVAATAASVIAVSALMVGATAASAAYEELRPGAQSEWQSGNTSWRPSSPTTLIAQPFVQLEDGVLASADFLIANLPESRTFASVAIHEFTTGVGPAPSPVAGGQAGEVSYSSPDENRNVWAIIDFPERPVLTEGTHYAFVVNPYGNEDAEAAVSHVIRFGFDVDPSTRPYEYRDGAWHGYGNAHYFIFNTTLVTLFAETDEPTLIVSEQCDVDSTVQLPASEGVVYTESRDGDYVYVTAVAADGYEMEPDAVTDWEFTVAAEPCPVVAPEEDPADLPKTDEPQEDELAATGVLGTAGWAATAVTLMLAGGVALVLARGARARRA